MQSEISEAYELGPDGYPAQAPDQPGAPTQSQWAAGPDPVVIEGVEEVSQEPSYVALEDEEA